MRGTGRHLKRLAGPNDVGLKLLLLLLLFPLLKKKKKDTHFVKITTKPFNVQGVCFKVFRDASVDSRDNRILSLFFLHDYRGHEQQHFRIVIKLVCFGKKKFCEILYYFPNCVMILRNRSLDEIIFQNTAL